MKDRDQNVCTGCNRHCPTSAPRCKYGRKYFSEISSSGQDAPARQDFGGYQPAYGHEFRHKHPRKWERSTIPGGLAWQLLFVSRRVKKALLHCEIAEDRLLDVLSPSEQKALSRILEKLNCRLG